jgi:hypothetical protein
MRKLVPAALIFIVSLVAASGNAMANGVSASYTDALNLLERGGYLNFTRFNTFGDSFEAMVIRKGQQVMVMVDPRHRRILFMR